MKSNHSEHFTEQDLVEMVLRLAHEIRNPLATIQSGIQLVQHLGPSAGETKEYLDSALVEVLRIDQIVKEMQRFVRLDARSAPGVVAVSEVVSQSVSSRLREADEAGVRLDVEEGPECRTVADLDQLIYSLAELVRNAIRFSPAGGTVRVEWHCTGESLVRISVTDEGPGIPSASADRILRPFFSTSTHGTGLGLNIVLRTCRIAGGDLKWNNRSGAGCRFSMMLPEAS